VDYKQKKMVVNHGGGNYRVHHEVLNKLYNESMDAAIIQMPDLLGLGAKNEHLIYFPVDTNFIKPVFKVNDKPTIGHFSSQHTIKGSEAISDIVNEFKAKYDFRFVWTNGQRGGVTPWTENLIRMSQCDVIIETFAMTAQGNKYGEWGNTALEAAALGKLVITNSLGYETYLEEYKVDYCPLLIANTEDQLKEHIEYVLTAPQATLDKHRREMRLWAEKYHSIPTTADRLWEKVYKEFF
jgi:hypothetical protein